MMSSVHGQAATGRVARAFAVLMLGAGTMLASVARAQQSGEAANQLPPASPAASIHEQILELEESILQTVPDLEQDGLSAVLAARVTLAQLAQQSISGIIRTGTGSEVLAADFVGYQVATAPRLSGRIVRVGGAADFATLQDAWPSVQPGDTILFAAGSFAPDRAFWRDKLTARQQPLTDLQFVGAGREETTLVCEGELEGLRRVRFVRMTFDLADDPLTDLRGPHAVHFVECRFTNYNSGSGGSNALYATGGAILLLERCIFDGRLGRAAGNSFGDAFDFRGETAMFARQCEFVDNDEISRVTGLETYDACVSKSASSSPHGILHYLGGILLERGNQARLDARLPYTTFTLATDDREIVDAALGRPTELDAFSHRIVDTLGLQRRISYWIGLLRHPDAAVRKDAAAQLRTLAGRDAPVEPGSMVLGDDPESSLVAEQIYARLITWFDDAKDNLVWDADTRRWRERAGDGGVDQP